MEFSNKKGLTLTHHLIAATRMLDTELDVALVVDGAGVRELVGLRVGEKLQFK